MFPLYMTADFCTLWFTHVFTQVFCTSQATAQDDYIPEVTVVCSHLRDVPCGWTALVWPKLPNKINMEDENDNFAEVSSAYFTFQKELKVIY